MEEKMIKELQSEFDDQKREPENRGLSLEWEYGGLLNTDTRELSLLMEIIRTVLRTCRGL